jgi:hypothetical protein
MQSSESAICDLELAWSEPDGFLYHVRCGHFDQAKADQFLQLLSRIDLPEEAPIERRLVSLLWYLPQFMTWQSERVRDSGTDPQRYQEYSAKVLSAVERLLGMP